MDNLKNNRIEETNEQEIKTVDDLLEKMKDEEEIGVEILNELSASKVSAGWGVHPADRAGISLSPRDDVGH